jgi:phytanoyl-CoA hydroxylase
MFESLWIDCEGAEATITELERYAETQAMANHLRHFWRFGYCIVKGAVSRDRIDTYLAELARDITRGALLASHGHEIINAAKADLRAPLTKVLDSHVYSPAACDIAFSPPIKLFLDMLFRQPPLAFQSLYFEVGSTQAIHNDTAYVVVDEHPKSLCAAWIALEDIAPGSGELMYYPGSHRFGDFLYAPGRKHWSSEEDGNSIHDHHLFWIHEEAKLHGIKAETFLPEKGDMLFWHADLCHGGGEIKESKRTRRSLVVHYCPVTESPHYLGRAVTDMKTKKLVSNGGYISSMYFHVE